MKPAPFEYRVPNTVREAVELLHAHSDNAKILAGGQSLMPVMNFRLARPGIVIDINRISGLGHIRVQGDQLCLGALARHDEVASSAVVREHLPLLATAASHIGHDAIRHRGTIGGSIAHADPAAEYPVVLAALGGHVRVQSVRGERLIAADSFFMGPFMTTVEPDEIVTEVILPTRPPKSGWSFVEFSRRHGDFALACAAVQVIMERGICQALHLALGGVGDVPVVPGQAIARATGRALDDATIDAVAAAVGQEIDPPSDIHGSAAYRRHLGETVTRQALMQARAMVSAP